MAIYPVTNAYVINKDAVVGSPFKSGMILMTNSAGKVVPADSQALISKTINEKQIAIIGVAAGDYNISGNTIIVPDYIGSNYLDSNSNFVSASDREFLSIRRQLLDYADETVNEYYNINYSPKPFRTGIGVYSLSGESFITDQFSPVLHGDYGLDSNVIQSLNPGDLLTFGGGINAGKLVKINTNSFGPDVLVVGIVDRYNVSTGLLYFRLVNYAFSFGSSSSTILALDAGLITSYPGSGTVWYDLSGNSRNFTLTNGPVYSSTNSGVISFDGTNDYAELTYTLPNNTITVMVWYYSGSWTTQSTLDSLISNDGSTNSGMDIRKVGNDFQLIDWFNSSATSIGPTIGSISDNSWYLVVYTYDGTRYKTYLNNTKTNDSSVTGPRNTTAQKIQIANEPFFGGGARALAGYVSEVRILNQALTSTQITNYYNNTKSRYGL